MTPMTTPTITSVSLAALEGSAGTQQETIKIHQQTNNENEANDHDRILITVAA